jgi:predicted GH43/DUF377 family glycosyl hydrolase
MSAIHGSSFLITSVALIGLLQVRAHDQRPPNEADPTAGLPLQEGWLVHAQNPCLSFGDLRKIAAWNDPSVLKHEGHYVMYVTTSMNTPGQPPVLPFRATSADGLSWRLDPATPLLVAGKSSTDFDFQSVETPSVAFFKGKHHMYYTGVGKGLSGPMAIGQATSDDGIHWTKDPNNPVLRPTGNPNDVNGFQVAEPGAAVRGDEIYLYFSSVGLRPGGDPPAKRVIALAKSPDGSRFSAPEIVLEQGDLYPAALGFDGYSTPSAAVHDGRVHLFFDVGYFNNRAEPKWTQVALHHAVSSDGETNWRQDSKPIFTRRSFDWTSLEIRSPTPLFEGNVLRLWFAGHAEIDEIAQDVKRTGRTRKFGIGYATTDASMDHASRP